MVENRILAESQKTSIPFVQKEGVEEMMASFSNNVNLLFPFFFSLLDTK